MKTYKCNLCQMVLKSTGVGPHFKFKHPGEKTQATEIRHSVNGQRPRRAAAKPSEVSLSEAIAALEVEVNSINHVLDRLRRML